MSHEALSPDQFGGGRSYTPRDVDESYQEDEGFDPEELDRYKQDPHEARFDLKPVPITSLYQQTHQGLQPAPTWKEMAEGRPAVEQRLQGIRSTYEHGGAVPPIITVQDGKKHIIQNGMHRAAVHEAMGRHHIDAFVTQRDKFE